MTTATFLRRKKTLIEPSYNSMWIWCNPLCFDAAGVWRRLFFFGVIILGNSMFLSADLNDITVLLIATWNSLNKCERFQRKNFSWAKKHIFLLNMAMFGLELAWALLSALFISRAVNWSVAWTLYRGPGQSEQYLACFY